MEVALCGLFSYNEPMSELLYAVQPGTVTLYDGSTKTWTAVDLATAYGVQDEPYLTVNSDLDLPRDPAQRMKYLVLVPRADDKYQNIMYTAEDDGEDIAYRPDFDGDKPYLQETPRRWVDPDVNEDYSSDRRTGEMQT